MKAGLADVRPIFFLPAVAFYQKKFKEKRRRLVAIQFTYTFKYISKTKEP